MASSTVFSSHAAIVINEIDYDQPGTDNAEFIEIFNSGAASVSLDNYSIDLINGSTSASYLSIDLTGFSINTGGYFVMCDDGALVANCDYVFTTSSGWFQNGAPDGIALYDNGTLLDSLTYEGVITPFTEGTALSISDNNTDIISIARIPDGFDSDDNDANFRLGCITPGSANIAGSGDCSISAATGINAVPIPAAAWLFGTGLIGLAGFARRR